MVFGSNRGNCHVPYHTELRANVRATRYTMSSHAHKPGSPGTLSGVNGSVHGEARQAQSRKAIIRMLGEMCSSPAKGLANLLLIISERFIVEYKCIVHFTYRDKNI
ncbi:hypothetical protein EVAR_57145_1 [Eumeta japonica]|uniref:Uncharacterized protein n=1 Tax=Eumeta variegata TaxID=151549 RepID=A0A4C1YW15_EUMVA|nr:hypothetical protein EVAR_57145_1 [Eumeta japonica]